MAGQLKLYSPATGDIYLHSGSASTASYNGSGSPWTSASTTPFSLGNNSRTGSQWTPTAPPPESVYQGGPPFQDGQRLVLAARPNVEEVIPIQARATSIDNKIALLNLLRKANTGLFYGPIVLTWQPNDATNPTGYLITEMSVQELAGAIHEERGRDILRCQLTITRLPWGGRFAGVNAFGLSFENIINNGIDNAAAFVAPKGDIPHEGLPLNIRLNVTDVTTNGIAKLWMGAIHDRTRSAASGSSTTTSTSGVTLATINSVDVYSALTTTNANLRFMVACSSVNANTEIAVEVYLPGPSGDTFLWRSPYVPAYDAAGNVVTTLFDTGDAPITDLLRSHLRSGISTVATLKVLILVRSATGSAVAVTANYLETIWYYTWMRLDESGPGNDGTNAIDLIITQFRSQANYPALPDAPPVAVLVHGNGTGDPIVARPLAEVGSYPRIYPSSKLYIAWVDYLGGQPNDEVEATVSYAPLYLTHRGND